jgi:membrane-associated phospholipid phosphatase
MRTLQGSGMGGRAKRLLSDNRSFLVPLGLFVLLSIALLVLFTTPEVHLAIDAHHTPAGDLFFRLVTDLGDGWAVVLLVLILLFVRYRDAILVAAVNIVSALIVQVLKHGPFAANVRPLEYFRGTNALHLVPGVTMYSYNSFPSGHAATACATCFCLGLMTSNRWTKAALAVTGVTIAFSRVYLSQHFLRDICAGAVIGMLVSLAFALILGGRGENPGESWMDRSVIRRTRRSGA